MGELGLSLEETVLSKSLSGCGRPGGGTEWDQFLPSPVWPKLAISCHMVCLIKTKKSGEDIEDPNSCALFMNRPDMPLSELDLVAAMTCF